MSEYMESGKPLISVLLAVYEPRLDWFRKQLDSLNQQTYSNVRLYVRDDCSPTVPFEKIQALVEKCITNFPYQVMRNEQNLGSNLTFERLTEEAEGIYFAYCDQDDVWLPEKLTILQKRLSHSGSLLACSDMYVINGEGEQVADSITKVRKRHVFLSGDNLAKDLLIHNFVTGCTTLIYADTAKEAVPFCPYMIHDHYLALWCAEHGKIDSVQKPLIFYRIHGGNQTGILAGVADKTSYEKIRIDLVMKRIDWLQSHFKCSNSFQKVLGEAMYWLKARKQNWNRKGGIRIMWKYRKFSFLPSVAEPFLKYIPDKIFIKIVRLVQKNQI